MFKSQLADYRILKVTLTKSIFELPHSSYQPKGDLKLGLHRNNNVELKDKQFTVPLNVKVLEKESGFKMEVTMLGHFEVLTEDTQELDFKSFCNVNAPAIIYPYVRQHVRNLSLEAGFNKPIILPIVNFVKFAESAEQSSD